MTKTDIQISCQKIISGGQTGVDRGALDACLKNKFPCGGWCPKGRIAEDGTISKSYPLKETEQTDYIYRTRKNVADSDGTLIIADEVITGGTLSTLQIANNLNKPLLIIWSQNNSNSIIDEQVIDWLKINNISILNVAGSRKSEWAFGYEYSLKLISNLIYDINNSTVA